MTLSVHIYLDGTPTKSQTFILLLMFLYFHHLQTLFFHHSSSSPVVSEAVMGSEATSPCIVIRLTV